MTAKKPTLTILARDLADLLAPVLPLACRDDMLPIITGVNLERRGGWLLATATDRYRMGISRVPSAGPDDFTALVRATDCRRILGMFKATRYANPEITLTVDDGHLVVHAGGSLNGFEDLRVVFRLIEGPFPPTRALLAKTHAADRADDDAESAFNPAYLADFKHAARDGQPLVVLLNGPARPALVRCGDHFLGMLMPVRTSVDKTVKSAAWADVLAIPEQPESPATPPRRSTKKAS